MTVDELMALADAAPSRNEEGPRGTYGCACVSRDARNCTLMRYGWRGNFGAADEACECLCHRWDDDDDAAIDTARRAGAKGVV